MATILVVQILLFYLFSKLDIAVTFFEKLFEFQKRLHLLLFSWLPFSIGDFLYVILGIILIILMLKCIKKKTRKSSIIKILIILNLVYFLYQIFWGTLYFQKPIISKLPEKEITLQKRKGLALKYLEKCKKTRLLVIEDEIGVFKVMNITEIQAEIIYQQNNLPLKISNKKALTTNSFKPSIFKEVMNFTGILGYYNPFTAEAQYNAQLPSTYIPFTLSHESSHQLGYAREQEANFIGYLIGVQSSNLDLRYSTEYFTLKSLLNSIVYEDENFVKLLVKNYSVGMRRDRDFEKQFMRKHQGWLNDFFGITNNLFLKSNQQDGSITYSYFIDLLVRYET